MSETDLPRDNFAWIYFLRQLLISSGAWSCFFMLGLCTGSPTVLVPQLRREANSTAAVSPEMASWLPAVFSYSGMPWVIILPILVALVGRKITHSVVCVSTFIGFIIFYNSNDVYMILISEVFQGEADMMEFLLISSGAWSCFFMLGLCTGSPTVLVPQLRREANSTAAVSPEMASWLPAVFSYSGMPWVIILPILVALVGRKITHSVVCVSTFIGFIIFYNSNDVYMILISEVFQGVVTASYLTIAIAIITEYTSTKNRGLFLTIKSATFFWGILASNLIGTFFHWKNIALFGLVCSVYSLGTVYFWPESPLWLATKGRFDQCARAHRWLKGSSMSSEKELEKLISDHQNYRRNISLKNQVMESIKVVVKKEFYKPVLFSVLLMALYIFSGKLVCTVYAIDILKKITNNESTAYAGMLILDAVTVSTMYVGCALSKAFKRRSLLLVSSSIAIAFLFLLSLYLYLVKSSIVSENKYISILLLIGYSVAISCGPMILSTSICGELISTDCRSLSMCVIALSFKIMYGTFVKISPYVFKALRMHGTFLLFALSSSVCLVFIYFYLPETKDMSLQEISDCIKGLKPVEETKELLPIVSKDVAIVPSNKSTVGE